MGLVLLGLGACSSGLNTHGNLPDKEVVEGIRPGVHDQQDVLGMLGSPSAVSTFEDNRWYYIGSRSETVAFFDPDVIERNVLVVSFSEDGMVDEKKVYTLNDGRDVDPVDRVTPTEGKELSVLQQLFGNVGRFSGAGTGQ
ncbi:MAG: outer membrane protein assembly factor BamE [Kiloniellales bacterium]|nr:outer membrane protein assembly factor BamE [Kiloniellales bacterium]